MRFRDADLNDIQYFAEHSTNKTVDRNAPERVDYVYVLEDDVPIGMGGFSQIVPSTYWCFIDLAPEAGERLLTAYRCIKEWMELFVEKMNVRRLQAFVRDVPSHVRLVEHLGFEKESVMKNFYGNEDAFMYRRIF